MASHMKTTINISDSLLQAAKDFSARENVTLRELVEEGLREVLEKRARSGDFRLRSASFQGRGLQSGISEGSWERIRDMIYEGRGT